MTPAPLPPDHRDRLALVRLALDGLSVGDAYGELFFRDPHRHHLTDDAPYQPPGPWEYTDDTEMALGIAEVLVRRGRVDQDDLAATFGRRFLLAPSRGYGPGALRLLTSVAAGGVWRLEAKALFGGMGSFGNGSAMRVAPVGAYFAGDGLDVVAEQARLSAAVTHAHPDGIAGGVAVAVAAAFAVRNRGQAAADVRAALFETVLAHTPPGDVRRNLEHAAAVDPALSPRSAAGLLGNGRRVTCPDTVPFCLWVFGRSFGDYPTAIWDTVRQGGDIDTNAAIVGGLSALAGGPSAIPPDWLAAREALQIDGLP